MDHSEEFAQWVRMSEQEVQLERLALLIAVHARPGLDIDASLGEIDALAARVVRGDLQSLLRVLFVDEGFGGNTVSYYEADNSLLDAVLRRRTGNPITLSVLLIAVGVRSGIDLLGIGMPGHFLVRLRDDVDGFIDPFNSGATLDTEGCAELFGRVHGAGASFQRGFLEPVGPFAIIERMLNNLLSIYRSLSDPDGQLWVSRLRASLPQATVLQQADVAVALANGRRFDAAAEIFDRLSRSTDPATARSLLAARDRMRSLMN